MRLMILMGLSISLASCSESGGSADTDGDGTITGEEIRAATADLDPPKPGRWEASSEVVDIDIPGLPEGMKSMAKGMYAKMFANTNYCLTPEQAEQDPEALWKDTQGDCSWESFEMRGNRVEASAVCKGPDGASSRMTMTGTHSPTSYSADNEMSFETDQGNGSVKVHVEGRHVGDCDGSEMS